MRFLFANFRFGLATPQTLEPFLTEKLGGLEG
jgi:hypothetical protein